MVSLFLFYLFPQRKYRFKRKEHLNNASLLIFIRTEFVEALYI